MRSPVYVLSGMVASLMMMMMMMFDFSGFEVPQPLEPDLMSAVAAANPG